jgi:SEC-C motif-containing protein
MVRQANRSSRSWSGRRLKRNSSATAGAPCPCGSSRSYALCCGARHDGSEPAQTPEAVMRARYAAYVLEMRDYLMQSWHPDSRPPSLDWAPGVTWLRLEVIESSEVLPDATRGTVRFVATYRMNGRAVTHREQSRFEKVNGAWLYRDGLVGP